jgi:uncharacterized protein (TIGR02271 family)
MLSNIDRVQPGWKVITSDNENVGEIEAIGTSEILVRKGWLFPTDRNLPIGAIQTVDPVDETIYLGITKDQVEGLADGTWTLDQAAVGGAWGAGSVMASDAVTNDLDAPVADTGYASGTAQDSLYGNAATTAETDETVRLQTHEERIQARPVAHQVGEVDIRKDVVEETQTIEVPVRREEVVVERRPATGGAVDDASFTAESDTIRVPVMEEQVEINKVVRPVEEVEVSKRVVEDRETVTDTVRREELRIDADEDVIDRSGDRGR